MTESESLALPERYQVIGKLGHGGMGRVWLAQDTWLKREVALKQLIPSDDEAADRARRRKRVLREAQALAQVKHPSIVPIHDIFDIKRDPWIVMEYIKGQSLDKIIGRERRLGERVIAQIGLRVLDGLVTVHRKGIVHRDVKPGNILVTAEGGVFLIDFGIARSASDPSLTGMKLLGTLEFLAPERFKGGEAGPPSDVWSLGVTLFCALEGYSPFGLGEPSPHAIMMAVLEQFPVPAQRGPLADIILRMLDKDPDRRAKAPEIRKALERIASKRARQPARSEPSCDPSAQPPGAPVSATALANLEEEVVHAGANRGASMLLSLDVPTAARIVADTPAKERGALLQGIAADEPYVAATILRMLLADTAGPAFAGLLPATAASLLAAMPTPEAARILGGTNPQAAVKAIEKLPPEQAAARLRLMLDRQRAAELLSLVAPQAAAAIADADPQCA